MKLKKEDALFSTDEKGNLIPHEVELVINNDDILQKKYKGQFITVTPITRGEIKKLFAEINNSDDPDKLDFDSQIILKHCIEPKFTDVEIKNLKPELSTPIVNTIFKESGIPVGEKK